MFIPQLFVIAAFLLFVVNGKPFDSFLKFCKLALNEISRSPMYLSGYPTTTTPETTDEIQQKEMQSNDDGRDINAHQAGEELFAHARAKKAYDPSWPRILLPLPRFPFPPGK